MVVDAIGQTDNGSYTVTSSSAINSNITLNNITCLLTNDIGGNNGTGTNNGRIVINISGGGTPPYTHRLQGGFDDVDITQVGNVVTFNNLTYGSNEYGNEYYLTLEDNAGCSTTSEITIYRPEVKLDGIINYGGGHLTVTPIGGFGDTYDPDTGILIGFYQYIWEVSTNGGGTWLPTGITSQSFVPTPGLWRCVIRDNNGTGGVCEHTTNIISV